jgi:penicillin amidase
MATGTAPPRQAGRRLRPLLITLAVALALALLAVLGAAAWLYSAGRAALPQLDGVLTLQGLSAPVTVIRDAQGVPHVTAAALEDLLFAQGYVTAQDRLWQMDLTRRYAAGEMAEILGPGLVEHDRQQRILGLRQVADAAVARLTPQDRALFQAYARGVNAYVAQSRDHLPLEFRLLGYAPRPWAVEDSVLCGLIFHEMLTFRHARTLLDREWVLARVGPQLAADLYPTSSWRDRLPGEAPAPLGVLPPPQSRSRRFRPAPAAEGLRLRLSAPAEDFGLVPGSNNWVVSGAHTATGLPLLSNDMHLPHQIPNVWYEVQLTAGDFDVAGFTAPGLPFVVVGHNRRIAWGLTSVEPFVLDLYVESFNSQGEYQAANGWRKAEHRQEVIHVKGGPDVAVDVTLTRHGPIVTTLIPGETRPLALRWTLYESSAMDIASLFALDSAQNWQDFLAAIARFPGPPQNVVYADVDGHIGYHIAGLFPLRPPGMDSTGPVAGNDDAHEWQGLVPFDQLPSVFDPPSGIIATANARILPPGSTLISADFDAPYRTERIYRVLESGKKLVPADMLALQTDIYSEFDRFCAQRLVYAVDHAGNPSRRARRAADLMRAWDGRLTADSAAPSIETAARRELTRRLLEPRLGPGSGDPRRPAGWERYHWGMSAVWLETVLLRQPLQWLPPGFTSYDDLLAAAVQAALDGKGVPRNLAAWRWGRQSPVALQHPIFGRIPLLRYWSGPGTQEQSGGRYTVKQVGRTFGPSERMTVDFSDMDRSTFNLVTGESGHLLSPHYLDQWPAWYEGHTFTLPFSAAAAQKAKTHELVLQPQ